MGGYVELIGDTRESFVLGRALPYRSVTFDSYREEVILARSYLLFGRKTETISFEGIEKVCLTYLETPYTTNEGTGERVIRKWTILLALKKGRYLTLVEERTDHAAWHPYDVSARLAYWENLATKMGVLTGKRLVRPAGVPGSPRTFVEDVNQILQHRLRESEISPRSVYIGSHADGGLEIVVNGKRYRDLNEIDDVAVCGLIRAAIDEWERSHL
jgi:hypothetical protein